ncbi:DUF6597 domain-containing transcriptional factor [Oryzobacter terrae]|uniref:helix-turn-helix transcriptional regulator n=1 Tax=Oryzobacter terrae TaxID=1620385 RepID=UPI00367248CD
MAARTKATGGGGATATRAPTSQPTASTSGILRPDLLARHVDVRRWACGPGVERWVENHWSLRWDLPDGTAFPSQTLPHPTCSLTLEVGDHTRDGLPPGEVLLVTGVVTRRFDVEVRGRGRVAGVRFRPGGLAALTNGPARDWTDAVVPASDVLPDELCAVLSDPALAEDPERWAAAAEDGLVALDPGPDEHHDLLLAVCATMLADHDLLTVTDVAARFATSARTLQRLFLDLVGVGPKWVLARYRMHDAVAELDAGFDGTLADLAHRWGWYDQAHFTRDFTALVGVTPAQYRDRPRA